MAPLPPVLVLDLDGTLVDTIDDLVAALNAILAREGARPATRERVRAIVGNGARAMIEAAFAAEQRSLAPNVMEELYAAYLDQYAAHVAERSRPFPGAEAMLDRFAAAGWRLAICTNKLESLSRALLGALGLADRFAAIAGQDTFAFRKPDPRHLTETIRLAGGSVGRAVMVGDSITDVDTAIAADIPVIAVDFGYSSLPAAELGATRVIARLDQLWDAVASLKRAAASP
ncbi:MAG: HAD hydrolase-like protein [Bauldia sp.]